MWNIFSGLVQEEWLQRQSNLCDCLTLRYLNWFCLQFCLKVVRISSYYSVAQPCNFQWLEQLSLGFVIIKLILTCPQIYMSNEKLRSSFTAGSGVEGGDPGGPRFPRLFSKCRNFGQFHIIWAKLHQNFGQFHIFWASLRQKFGQFNIHETVSISVETFFLFLEVTLIGTEKTDRSRTKLIQCHFSGKSLVSPPKSFWAPTPMTAGIDYKRARATKAK